MKTTEILKNEHEIIKTMIIKTLDLANTSVEINADAFSLVCDFFTKYADGFHHKKEEDIYFKWMVSKNPNLKFGPIAAMLYEHNSMREFLKQSKESFLQRDMVSCRLNLNNFCLALKNHIMKEDQILYQIAEEINKASCDGDEKMFDEFVEIQKNDAIIFNRWKDTPIHPSVLEESKIQRGSGGNCCGLCS